MRLRTCSLVGVVPIFTVLSLAVSALVYFLIPREVEWVYREEVGGFAVGIHAFVHPKDLEKLAGNTLSDKEKQAMVAPIHRLFETTSIQKIAFVDPMTGREVISIDDGATTDLRRPSPMETFENREPGSDMAAVVIEKRDARSWARAVKMVRTDQGRPIALLVVETDASGIDKTKAEAMHLCIIGSSVTLLVGLISALFINGVLHLQIRRLSSAATAIASGSTIEHLPYHPRGGIREFNDLWNTVETMAHVIRSEVSRSRNRLMNTERFPDPKALVDTLGQHTQSDTYLRQWGLEICVAKIGDGWPEGLVKCVSMKNRLFLILGSVSVSDNPLETGMRSAAAMQYVTTSLMSSTPAEALTRVASLFDFSELQVVSRDETDDTLYRYELSVENREVEMTSYNISKGPIAFTVGLHGNAVGRINLYLHTFEVADTITENVKQIASIIERMTPPIRGAVAVVRRLAGESTE